VYLTGIGEKGGDPVEKGSHLIRGGGGGCSFTPPPRRRRNWKLGILTLRKKKRYCPHRERGFTSERGNLCEKKKRSNRGLKTGGRNVSARDPSSEVPIFQQEKK